MKGVDEVADLAIHNESDEGNRNIHAHIMTTVRPLNENGTWGAKSKKEYLLDEQGNRILGKNRKPKTRKVELTTWNDKGNAEKWRENFADLCNRYLKSRPPLLRKTEQGRNTNNSFGSKCKCLRKKRDRN